MFLLTDVLVVGLRALTFVALFQAVGTQIFLTLYGDRVAPETADRCRLLGRVAAAVALTAAVFDYVLTPARMAGDLGSTFDPSLESLLLESTSGTANIARVVGLGALALALDSASRFNTIVGRAGAALALVSFLLTGHTSIHELRWLLAPLLLVHLVAAAFWFGSLGPLLLATRYEPGQRSGALVEQFSRFATRIVPAIFVCGLIMAVLFIRSFAELATGYGAIIVGKTLGFAVLMGLAGLNKWRYAPGLLAADAAAGRSFRRTVAIEWGLIAAILMATSIMTSLFAPEGLHGAFGEGHDAEH